jgi:hypothetical protein
MTDTSVANQEHRQGTTPPNGQRVGEVRTQAAFRFVNEELQWLNTPDAAVVIVCECADPECLQRLEVPPGVYEGARTKPAVFLLAPGHELEGLDYLVSTGDGYVVAEKRGEDAKLAGTLDPRAA